MDATLATVAAVALTKVVRFLTRQTGENATTPQDPVRVYNPETDAALLERECVCCIAWDNDGHCVVKEYGTVDFELPTWLDPEDWLYNTVAWKYTWGLGVEKTWPESWQRGLYSLPRDGKLLACVKLLKTKKFRSTFRQSLRDQLVAWLETPADQRCYDNPFSARQWAALVDVYTARAAKGTSESLYYTRRCY